MMSKILGMSGVVTASMMATEMKFPNRLGVPYWHRQL